MKFTIKFTKKPPAQNRSKWHVHFAWLPVRIDLTTCVWLERIARRRMLTHYAKVVSFGRFSLNHDAMRYEYGPITNILMQPGLENASGASVSDTQANRAAVQSGSCGAIGQQVQTIYPQRTAHASGPPPGGLNATTTKPGS